MLWAHHEKSEKTGIHCNNRKSGEKERNGKDLELDNLASWQGGTCVSEMTGSTPFGMSFTNE